VIPVRLRKSIGLVVALSMSAFLLGLSYSHNAVPGDMFQFVRSVPTHAVPIADVSHAKKMASPDGNGSPHHLSAILHEAAAGGPPTAGAVVTAVATIHSGRCAGAPGCRGPPTS
jgi:hypothetical protein